MNLHQQEIGRVPLTALLLFVVSTHLSSTVGHATAMDQFVWIAAHGSTTVLQVDKATTSVVASIDIGASPFGVAVDDDSVWVTHYGSSAVSRISKSTHHVTQITVNPQAFGIAVDADYAWVTAGSGYAAANVSRIDKTTNAVDHVMSLGSFAWGLAVDDDFAWVARDGFVTKIAKATGTVVADIAIGPSPRGIAATDKDFIWVADFSSQAVIKISKSTNLVVATISTVGHNPHGIAVDTNSIWVAAYFTGAILKIDKASNAVLTIAVENGPYLHGVSLDADAVWTDGYFSENIYRIDRSSDSIGATIPATSILATFGDSTGFTFDFLTRIVTVDIKPGSFPNSINLGSGGSVPVAILSMPTFDARAVNPSTVRLASAAVRLRGNGTPMAAPQDVNGDGLIDLVVHVDTEALQLSDGDTEATLTGETFAGKTIRGVDSVRIVP